MAIYAYHGFYAAGCLVMAYPLYRWWLNPSFLSDHKDTLTGGAIKEFVDHQAEGMGLIKKEIVVFQGQDRGYRSYGNTWFSGKVGIEVGKDVNEKIREFNIAHQLAHLKANDDLIIFGGALAATLFTTFILAVNRDLFTRYLGGLGVGLIVMLFSAKPIERRADMTAMQFCSRAVNQACLDKLLREKERGGGRGLYSWIFCLVEPSLDEKIGYFQAHLQLQRAE